MCFPMAASRTGATRHSRRRLAGSPTRSQHTASAAATGSRVLLPQLPETPDHAFRRLEARRDQRAHGRALRPRRAALPTAGLRRIPCSSLPGPALRGLRPPADELPDLRLVVSVDGAADGAVAWADFVGPASDSRTTLPSAPGDPALMIYTSGTTGPPKGALHGHRVLLGHLPGIEMSHDFFPQPGDLFWTPADWAWAGGLLDCLLPSLYFGVPVVASRGEKFDPEAAFALIAGRASGTPSSRRPR